MYRPVDADAIPDALTRRDQWVCWQDALRDGKPTKVPLDPDTGDYASVADESTWSTFGQAYNLYHGATAVSGIGYVFTTTDPYVGVDLDDCRDPKTGELDDWAQDIIHRLDSYTEASPSGTGVHVIVRGDIPAAGNRNGAIECYQDGRYFTVTGHHLNLMPETVNDRADALAAIHAEYVTATEPDGDAAEATPTVPEATDMVDLPDDDLIAYALNASNGDKFRRLWNGDTSGYKSHSEADQALCNLLAFWTGGDPQRMERLFAKSGLVRDKWREREDYRERTIENAIEGCQDFYSADR